MINILIAEDNEYIATLIKLSLKQMGYYCDVAYDGEEAANMAEKKTYDLVLLDVMMPKIDGFTLFDYIHQLKIPVIFITAKNSVNDRVKGLKMGADDYIVKPFEVLELQARVEVVLRRYNKTSQIINIGGLEIDTDTLTVRKDGEILRLTPKEYELLVFLARNPGKALYRETIYERVWGGELEYGSKTVDLHIQRLRKKAGWEKRLVSVSKIGYKLEL
ncbi:MAG: response regulator transcription factor [Ruminococcaceae bacterium]|nr:response regulator transcription factor [Oscillospiraceae bacterium]